MTSSLRVEAKGSTMETSRVILKNLPSSMTESALRTHLTSTLTKLEVTDVSLKLDSKGKSRRFAFVGFKNNDETREAREKLNNAYIGTAKIRAEFALDMRSEKQKVSRESGKSDGSQSEAKETPTNSTVLSKFKGNEKFEEFLRVNNKSLDVDKNKDGKTTNVTDDGDNEDEDDGKKEVSVSDLDYLKSKVVTMEEESDESKMSKSKKKKEPKQMELFTLKMSNLPYKAKKKEVKGFFKPLKVDSIRVPRKVKGIAYVAFKAEDAMKKALRKNNSFMGEHRIQVKKYIRQDISDERQAKWSAQSSSVSSESVAESGRLFIRNLAYSVTEDDIEELFKPFGLLAEVHLPLDPISRRIKGFGFVQFALPENAVQASNELDGSTLQGRLLHIMPAKSKDEEEDESSPNQTSNESSFKKEKLKKQRKEASLSHNWNSLFLGASAVADIVADRFEMDKSDVLLDNSDKDNKKKSNESAAVKLALAETQVVMETKAFLEEHGVHLDAFNDSKAPRSKTLILAKNLGASTKVELLRNLFGKYGRLERVLLPPQGVTALIDFEQPAEARVAFKALAYRRVGSAPLYLEWAPLGAIKKDVDHKKEVDDKCDEKEKKTEIAKETNKEIVDDKKSEGARNESTTRCTLFVKNLNFDTDELSLKAHFESVGPIEKSVVARKNDGLSMGYGFVTYKVEPHANEALKKLQHSMLDEHSLELKRSTSSSVSSLKRKSDDQSSSTSDRPSSKLLVRNVAFEATSKELRSLFAPFGSLKHLRLPKKATGGHRGFAFVDYESREEAESALETLGQSTHLYGRRLVLAYSADDDDSIEAMQRQAATRYVDDKMANKGGRSKKAKMMEALQTAVDEDYLK